MIRFGALALGGFSEIVLVVLELAFGSGFDDVC